MEAAGNQLALTPTHIPASQQAPYLARAQMLLSVSSWVSSFRNGFNALEEVERHTIGPKPLHEPSPHHTNCRWTDTLNRIGQRAATSAKATLASPREIVLRIDIPGEERVSLRVSARLAFCFSRHGLCGTACVALRPSGPPLGLNTRQI